MTESEHDQLIRLKERAKIFHEWLEQQRGYFMDDSGESALMTVICRFDEIMNATVPISFERKIK